MANFEKLNIINGFDIKDLKNAKQNNYEWCMAELGDYIYVGTGRNIPWMLINSISQTAKAPLLFSTTELDNTGEIWRYKKDDSLPWQRVYKASKHDNIAGFRFMINHSSKNSSEALYAASVSRGTNAVKILKSTDGSNWTVVNNKLQGTSSRTMVSFNGKLYLACVNDSPTNVDKPLLYYSEDPEFYNFKLITDVNNKYFIKDKNPNGGIDNIAAFNNKLYVSVRNSNGIQIWRSNSENIKINDWTCVVDTGFGDSMNVNSAAMGVFGDYLYVSAIKKLPLSLLIPMGSDMIRIDKHDKWELVVGGKRVKSSKPSKGERSQSISGYESGFSNPFNLYIWQIQSYNGILLASTFDNGSNIEVIRDVIVLNKDLLVRKLGETAYNLLLEIFETTLYLFDKYNYPRGFDLYASCDGVHFKPVCLDGLGNGNNYGGRILMVDKYDDLYVGTANPYDGCEVHRLARDCDLIKECKCDERKLQECLYRVERELSEKKEKLYIELERIGLSL